MNSYLAQRDLVVNDLQNDLRDGVLLNSFLEIISNKPVRIGQAMSWRELIR